ncbi:MAG: hypothetical protein QMD08_00475 [Actinomycetota bacterium]|nr:hypothetical protein [Actinomycetota bacterium]
MCKKINCEFLSASGFFCLKGVPARRCLRLKTKGESIDFRKLGKIKEKEDWI